MQRLDAVLVNTPNQGLVRNKASSLRPDVIELPPEIVEIIFGFRPWIGLVLSRRLRIVALRAINTVPLVNIPKAGSDCYHSVMPIDDLVANTRVRATVMARGYYTHRVVDTQDVYIMDITLSPGKTTYILHQAPTGSIVVTANTIIMAMQNYIYINTPAMCVDITYLRSARITI